MKDQIYGLMAQAEEIQTHAVKVQAAAQEALTRLPEATRDAVREAVKEIFTDKAAQACRGLSEAASDATDAAAKMTRVSTLQAVFLVIAALLIFGLAFGSLVYLSNSRLEELAALKAAVQAEQEKLAEITGKTWGLELTIYSDGTRGIILPKGMTVEKSGPIKGGREAILIKKQ